MIPILFKASETSFTSNGVGRLSDAIFARVTEERNGQYELEMEYPIMGAFYSEIELLDFVFAVPAHGKSAQPFEIYSISRPLNGRVVIKARHISYRLNKITVGAFTASTCAAALLGLKNNSVNANPFTFWTDKNVTANFAVKTPAQLRGLLGGQEGSILDVYGTAEYEFDMFNVRLYQNRGSDNGVTVLYGKNLTDINAEQNAQSVYTGIAPYYFANDVLVTLPEKALYGEHRGDYPYDMVVPVNFSERFDEAPTVAQLRAAAQSYIASSSAWEINGTLKISFVNLADTEEYKNVSAAERVNLCDTVTVKHPALGVSTKAKVVKTVYDVLKDAYSSIELGSVSVGLGQAISESIRAEVPSTSMMEQAIANGTKLITGNQGGYVVLKTNANGKPEEILIMDTEDISTATKVWRFNNSGLGYSNTGYNGTYKQAWTIDGAFYTDWVTTGLMTANIIKAGILSDKAGKNSWNMVTGVFELNAAAKVGDTGYTLTQIKANAEGLQTKVEANGVISAINQTAETIKIQASKVNLSGYVTMTNLSTDGQTTINGGNITTGIIADANNNTTFNLANGTLNIGKGSITLGSYFSVSSTGSMVAKRGTIGGWTIADSGIYKARNATETAAGYRVDISAPADDDLANTSTAFRVRTEAAGATAWTNTFYVRYDGYIYAIGGGRIGAWTLGAGANGALYNTRDQLYTNKNGVYIGRNGIAVGGSTKTGNNYAYFEANTAGSIVYINQLHFRNEDGSTSAYGWNVDGDHLDRIHTGGAIDVNSDGGGTTYLRGKNEINGYQKSSDRRIKSNIKTITAKNAKKFIMALRPVSHTYKKKYKGYYLEGIHHAFIAQEAREAVVDGWALVSESDEGILGIRYDEIVADVIALMQEQEKRIEKLEGIINGHTDCSR